MTLNIRVDRRVQWIILLDRRYHKKNVSTVYIFLILKSQQTLMEKYYLTVKRTFIRCLLFLRLIITTNIYPTLSYTLLNITDIVFVSLKSQIFCNYAFRCKSKSHLICKCRQNPVVRPVCPCNLTKKISEDNELFLRNQHFFSL